MFLAMPDLPLPIFVILLGGWLYVMYRAWGEMREEA
jgi:hypothetical protein